MELNDFGKLKNLLVHTKLYTVTVNKNQDGKDEMELMLGNKNIMVKIIIEDIKHVEYTDIVLIKKEKNETDQS